MEVDFIKGGSNITITNEDFLELKKLRIKEDIPDYKIIKNHISDFGGHFAKIIKVNKIKYILMYINNEKSMLKVVYDSAMNEELGNGLQIEDQDEIIPMEALKAGNSKDV
ncbi:hypothetical protein C1646_759931 [Rhizophagus diaphanus]|nr:hypothetical protein C1646_759931 [Rhizophagus diaphanus] [Rhizophagus sp. MUCL 43196]